MVSKQGKAVGPRIVRAWFDSVINPLIRALETERFFAELSDWTWRHRRRALERICPVRNYLGPDGQVNLEQFLDVQTEVREPMRDHDEAVRSVRDACVKLHTTLVDTLQQLARPGYAPGKAAVADWKAILDGPELQQVWKSHAGTGAIDLLAEYIANNTPELDAGYVTAVFWNKHRASLLGLLTEPSLQVHKPHQATLAAGKTLVVAADRVSKRLKEIRRDLSLRHDVPYVLPIRTGEHA